MNILSELQYRNLIQDSSDSELFSKLKPGDSFYVGFDPSAPSLQIGNLVPVITAIRLAKAGFKPIILYGGSTGSIGDPSGKSAERNLLDQSSVEFNIKNHKSCLSEILKRAGVQATYVNNMDWTKDLSTLDFLREIGKHFTIAYMLSKEVVKNRVESTGISFTEFSYMILQAFDFLHLFQNYKCKLQIGGSDQWGNITAGLELIRRKLQGEVYAFSIPLVTDSQGKKFGKSEGGAVWLDSRYTSPYKLHQFWLNVPDADVVQYLKIFTFLSVEEISELEQTIKSAPEKRAAQTALADAVCDLVHGPEATKDAKRSAQVLFGGSIEGLSTDTLLDIFQDAPSSEMPRDKLKSISVIDLLSETKVSKSKGEARRLIESGGAYINNERVSSVDLKVSDTKALEKEIVVIRSGKKNYHLVKVLKSFLIALTLSLLLSTHCWAEETDEAAVSPKPGWGDFQVVEETEEYSWWQTALLWIPNRFMDFIDIFRIDAGVGPAFGAVVRVTKYGQAGYRMMTPASLRVGDFGRNSPLMVESSNEFGIGPAFVNSKDREICFGELGAGADLLLVGAYVGFCPEEVFDFLAGLFFLDVMDDDFH